MLGQKVPRKETSNGHHELGKGQIQVASMEASNSEAKEMKRKRVPSGELGGASVKPMKYHENFKTLLNPKLRIYLKNIESL